MSAVSLSVLAVMHVAATCVAVVAVVAMTAAIVTSAVIVASVLMAPRIQHFLGWELVHILTPFVSAFTVVMMLSFLKGRKFYRYLGFTFLCFALRFF